MVGNDSCSSSRRFQFNHISLLYHLEMRCFRENHYTSVLEKIFVHSTKKSVLSQSYEYIFLVFSESKWRNERLQKVTAHISLSENSIGSQSYHFESGNFGANL